MPRQPWVKFGMSVDVSLDTTACFIFPRLVRERIGWVIPSKIKVDHLIDKGNPDAPVVIYFTTDVDNTDQSYTLSHLYRKARRTGGAKLRLVALVNNLIAPRVALPIDVLQPIYPQTNLCDMLVMLNSPKWIGVDFTMSGAQSISAEQNGVYQVLDAHNVPIRIGQGGVARRLQDYLRDQNIARRAKSMRYIPLSTEKNCLDYEQVFLAEHETVYGKLPEYNPIHRRL